MANRCDNNDDEPLPPRELRERHTGLEDLITFILAPDATGYPHDTYRELEDGRIELVIDTQNNSGQMMSIFLRNRLYRASEDLGRDEKLPREIRYSTYLYNENPIKHEATFVMDKPLFEKLQENFRNEARGYGR